MRTRTQIILALCATSFVILILVLLGSVHFHEPTSDATQIYSLLGTVIQTTATFGAVALAIVFLTAQLSGVGRPSVVRELYRSAEIYLLFGYAAITVLLGYFVMLTIDVLEPSWRDRLVDVVMVAAGISILLVLPAMMSQIENLDQTTVASKLAAKIKPQAIIDYGLTDVHTANHNQNGITYELITVGLRPRWVDPLRPLHELLMESVNARDRVLFGKLFRYLLAPIAAAHGVYWDYTGDKSFRVRNGGILTRLKARQYTLEEKIHITLAILHYSVKRARNLLNEWDGRDIGRHGILTAIGDLIRSLAQAADGGAAIRISLQATFHIERFYCKVPPYGRIEPMNSFFETAKILLDFGKADEAELCVRILGWVTVHTEQLVPERSRQISSTLPESLESIYRQTLDVAANDSNWTPMSTDDPWRSWPPEEGKASIDGLAKRAYAS